MIDPHLFVERLAFYGMSFFVGVPDSLLKNFCAYIQDNSTSHNHIITANEGNAIGMAAGHYMGTGVPAVVYLQNSGLGNTINPLTSLADKEVYKIPMLLIIGWRGEPNVKDEPQHIKQGRITPKQLDLLEIPYQVVDAGSNATEVVEWAVERLRSTEAPVALLVKKNTFSVYKPINVHMAPLSSLLREEALSTLLDVMGDVVCISTTGKTSRELYELRAIRGEQQQDFLTVGAMGHTASIAFGVALGKPDKKIVCIDGDGSLLMHLGALPVIGSTAPHNLIHVLLNNAAHESVGGQPTVADQVDFNALVTACGYRAYAQASTIEEVREAWSLLKEKEGPVMLEVRVSTGSRDDLGRPSSTPLQNKESFMKRLSV